MILFARGTLTVSLPDHSDYRPKTVISAQMLGVSLLPIASRSGVPPRKMRVVNGQMTTRYYVLAETLSEK